MSATSEPIQLSGDKLAEVSNAIVRILRNGYGRGPTKAKTYVVDRYLLTVLEDFLTTAEHTLIAEGHADMVRQVRLTFQEAIGHEFTRAVETITGHRVATYHSQVTFDPPIGFEIFVLSDEPAP